MVHGSAITIQYIEVIIYDYYKKKTKDKRRPRTTRTTLKMHSKVGLKTLDTHRTETIMYPQKCHYIGQFISFSRLTSSNSAGIIDKYTTWIITTTITPQTIQLLDILKI
jgi:hypothetical protein